jgi:hypothetical protein
VGIYGEYTGKIFEKYLSVSKAINAAWHLPSLGPHAMVTLFPSLGTDLLGCQSQNIHETRKEKQRMKQALYVRNSTNPLLPRLIGTAKWQPFGGFGVQGNSTCIGRG